MQRRSKHEEAVSITETASSCLWGLLPPSRGATNPPCRLSASARRWPHFWFRESRAISSSRLTPHTCPNGVPGRFVEHSDFTGN
jgi:hypothetical protein